ncbi:hypothetical protein D3C83_137040 [compost metagenome]
MIAARGEAVSFFSYLFEVTSCLFVATDNCPSLLTFNDKLDSIRKKDLAEHR